MPILYAILALMAFVNPSEHEWNRSRDLALEDLIALQGKWKFVTVEIAGDTQIVENEFYLIIRGRTIVRRVLHSDQQFDTYLRIGLPSRNASPKLIDLIDGEKVDEGIYELKNDELTICLGNRKNCEPAERPTEFSVVDRPHFAIAVLKRQPE